MIDMLAQAIGAQHEAAGPEGTLVQALDRLRVVRGFRQDGQREIAHDEARNSIWLRAGLSTGGVKARFVSILVNGGLGQIGQ